MPAAAGALLCEQQTAQAMATKRDATAVGLPSGPVDEWTRAVVCRDTHARELVAHLRAMAVQYPFVAHQPSDWVARTSELKQLARPIYGFIKEAVSPAQAGLAGYTHDTHTGGGRDMIKAAQMRRGKLEGQSMTQRLLSSYRRQRAGMFSTVARPVVAAGMGTTPQEQLRGVMDSLTNYQGKVFRNGATDKGEAGQFPLTADAWPAEGLVPVLRVRSAGTCTWLIVFCQVAQRRSPATLRIQEIVALGRDEEEHEVYKPGARSHHAVFAELSDSANLAATHYGCVHRADSQMVVLRVLMWLAHCATIFCEPCGFCGRLLNFDGAGAPRPPTQRDYVTFVAAHPHCERDFT